MDNSNICRRSEQNLKGLQAGDALLPCGLARVDFAGKDAGYRDRTS
jgi:hypothetical protein